MSISIYTQEVPFISTDQMREVDRLMIEEYNISLPQMMEQAGRNLADLAHTRFLQDSPQQKPVLILAGTGGNAGGGLVAARYLHQKGVTVEVILATDKERLAKVPMQQLRALAELSISIRTADNFVAGSYSLIIDALIGYSISGDPRSNYASLIEHANTSDVPILSLDTPSGLDTTSGMPNTPTIHATATMTLALPKIGFKEAEAQKYLGDLYLADITVPTELYTTHLHLNMPNDLFAEGTLMQL